MTSILGSESHLYLFNESSGAILDKVGSADSTSIGGAPVYNGNSVSVDGIDDFFGWSDANKPFDASADFTHYLKFKILEATSGVVIRLFGGEVDNTSPVGQWNDLTSSDLIQALGRGQGNGGTVSLNIGKNPDSTEIFTYAYSYKVSTKTMTLAIQSDDGVVANGSNVGTQAPIAQGFTLAKAFGQFGNLEFFQMGTVNGTAHSLIDLQDTVNALFPTSTGSVFPSAVPRAIPKVINSVFS